MKTRNPYRCIAACAGLLAAAANAGVMPAVMPAAVSAAMPIYSGPVAKSLPLAAPAMVWASVLALTLICVLWLVAMIALQPRQGSQSRQRAGLSWTARARRVLMRRLTLPVVFG